MELEPPTRIDRVRENKGGYRYADEADSPLVRAPSPDDQGQQILDQIFNFQMQAAYETGGLNDAAEKGVLKPYLDPKEADKMLSGVFRGIDPTRTRDGYYVQRRDDIAQCADSCTPPRLDSGNITATNTSPMKEMVGLDGERYEGKEIEYFINDGTGGIMRVELTSPVTDSTGERHRIWLIDTILPKE